MSPIIIATCIHFMKAPQYDNCRYSGDAISVSECINDTRMYNSLMSKRENDYSPMQIKYVCFERIYDNWEPISDDN